MSIYTVENFTSDITVEGYIAEFRDEPHFLELCVRCWTTDATAYCLIIR